MNPNVQPPFTYRPNSESLVPEFPIAQNRRDSDFVRSQAGLPPLYTETEKTPPTREEVQQWIEAGQDNSSFERRTGHKKYRLDETPVETRNSGLRPRIEPASAAAALVTAHEEIRRAESQLAVDRSESQLERLRKQDLRPAFLPSLEDLACQVQRDFPPRLNTDKINRDYAEAFEASQQIGSQVTPEVVLEALSRAVPCHPFTPASACQVFKASEATLIRCPDGSVFSRTALEASSIVAESIASLIARCCVLGRKQDYPCYVGDPETGKVQIDPDKTVYFQDRLPMLTQNGRIPPGYRLVIGVRRTDERLGYVVETQTPTWEAELECQWSLEPEPELPPQVQAQQ